MEKPVKTTLLLASLKPKIVRRKSCVFTDLNEGKFQFDEYRSIIAN